MFDNYRRRKLVWVFQGSLNQNSFLYTKGQLALNKDLRHKGIRGTVFACRFVQGTRVSPYRAVVPTMGGKAWMTGSGQHVFKEDGPFPGDLLL